MRNVINLADVKKDLAEFLPGYNMSRLARFKYHANLPSNRIWMTHREAKNFIYKSTIFITIIISLSDFTSDELDPAQVDNLADYFSQRAKRPLLIFLCVIGLLFIAVQAIERGWLAERHIPSFWAGIKNMNTEPDKISYSDIITAIEEKYNAKIDIPKEFYCSLTRCIIEHTRIKLSEKHQSDKPEFYFDKFMWGEYLAAGGKKNPLTNQPIENYDITEEVISKDIETFVCKQWEEAKANNSESKTSSISINT